MVNKAFSIEVIFELVTNKNLRETINSLRYRDSSEDEVTSL